MADYYDPDGEPISFREWRGPRTLGEKLNKVQGAGTIEIPGGPVPLIIKLGLNGSLTFPPGIDPVAALREAMMSFWEALGPVKVVALNPQEADDG